LHLFANEIGAAKIELLSPCYLLSLINHMWFAPVKKVDTSA